MPFETLATHDPIPQAWLDQIAQGQLPNIELKDSSALDKVFQAMVTLDQVALLEHTCDAFVAQARAREETTFTLGTLLRPAAREGSEAIWTAVWQRVQAHLHEPRMAMARQRAAEAAITGGHPERMKALVWTHPKLLNLESRLLIEVVDQQDTQALTWLMADNYCLDGFQLREGPNALVRAIRQGNPEMVRLLAQEVDPVLVAPAYGRHALDEARQHGPEMEDRLLEGAFTYWTQRDTLDDRERQLDICGRRLDDLAKGLHPAIQDRWLARLATEQPDLMEQLVQTRSAQRLRTLAKRAAPPARHRHRS